MWLPMLTMILCSRWLPVLTGTHFARCDFCHYDYYDIISIVSNSDKKLLHLYYTLKRDIYQLLCSFPRANYLTNCGICSFEYFYQIAILYAFHHNVPNMRPALEPHSAYTVLFTLIILFWLFYEDLNKIQLFVRHLCFIKNMIP